MCNVKNGGQAKKRQYIKWNEALIRDFIPTISECQLVKASEENGAKSKIVLKCSCGVEFEVLFNRFRNLKNKCCRKCSGLVTKWSYEDVKSYIEGKDGNGCELVSKTYINNREKLELICKCQTHYSASFDSFKNYNQKQCPDCGQANGYRKKSTPYSEALVFIRKNSNGCKLLTKSKDYKNSRTILLFECGCSKRFETTLSQFKGGTRQCKDCGRKIWREKNRISHEEIENYVESHGCKLISENCSGTDGNIDIMCKCKNIYTTTLEYFKKSLKMCPECSSDYVSKSMSFTYDEVKTYVEGEEGNGCKFLSKSYEGIDKYYDFLCECGQSFNTRFSTFKVSKKQCRTCFGKGIGEKLKHSYEYVKKHIESKSECVLLSKTYNGIFDELKLLCGCKKEFLVTLESFNKGRKRCRKCTMSTSKPEKKILDFLEDRGITFTQEFMLNGCKNEKHLRFDFAILDRDENLKFLIEYQGEGHYKPVNFGGMSDKKAQEVFEGVVFRDDIKNQYCKDNNIPLLKIPYWEFDNIEEILEYILNRELENLL